MMSRRSGLTWGAILALGSLLTGCLGAGELRRPDLSAQVLLGRWEALSSSLGVTGLIYEFQADGVVNLLVSDLEEAWLVGKYEIKNGETLRFEWREPSLGLSLGETLWKALFVSYEELLFELAGGERVKLRRLR